MPRTEWKVPLCFGQPGEFSSDQLEMNRLHPSSCEMAQVNEYESNRRIRWEEGWKERTADIKSPPMFSSLGKPVRRMYSSDMKI